MTEYNDLIFEISQPERTAFSLPESDVPAIELITKFSKQLIREEPAELPEVSEPQLMRHYTSLSTAFAPHIADHTVWFLSC